MNYLCIADDVKLGKDVKLSKFINLYGCTIGAVSYTHLTLPTIYSV